MSIDHKEMELFYYLATDFKNPATLKHQIDWADAYLRMDLPVYSMANRKDNFRYEQVRVPMIFLIKR